MAKGHRSKIKRERNEVRDTRPSAKLSYARVSVQKACFVLDAIRGKSVNEALAIVTYNPRYASSLVKKLLESAIANAENNYPEKNYKAENLYVAECFVKEDSYEKVTPVCRVISAKTLRMGVCFISNVTRGSSCSVPFASMQMCMRQRSRRKENLEWNCIIGLCLVSYLVFGL